MAITGKGKRLDGWLQSRRRRRSADILYQQLQWADKDNTEKLVWNDWFFDATAGGGDLTATVNKTLAPLTSGSQASLDIAGSSSTTLAALTSSSQAALDIAGSSSKTLAALTATATGDLASSGIDGAGNATLASLTSTSQASLDIAGGASKILAALTSTSTAILDIAAALAGTLQPLTLSSVGFNSTPSVGSSGGAIYQQQFRRRLR